MNENMHENPTATTADTATDQAPSLPSGQPSLPEDETTCACCGVVVKIADCTVTADGDLVCKECLDREYGQCDECGEWFPRDELTEAGNGYSVCESCLDDGYFCCEDCGTWYPDTDAVEVNPGTSSSSYVCEDCAERYYRQCDDCGNYFDDDHIALSDAYHDICTNCSDDWCSCSCCGEVMRVHNAVFDDDACEYYCSDCAPVSRLHGYGYKPDPVFGTTDGDDGLSCYYGEALTFGVELECDNGDSVSDALSDIDRITDRCYCKHDGSLSDGYEIVTHPGTLAWHKERFPWADVCKASLNNGFRSHETDTCGLHVHVGRDQLGGRPRETAAKMSLITYRLKDWFIRFSRRKGESRWTKYVKPESPLGDDKSAFLRTYYDQLLRDRYIAVNVQNGSTIEVRIFRGTLNPSTVLASLELVSNLALYARDHELEDCLAVTWDALVHYEEHEELTDYCSRRMTPLSDATTNDIPVAEPLPEPLAGDALFPCNCDIVLDDSDSSELQPGDIVCCVSSDLGDNNPVGCCGLVVRDRVAGARAWLLVEWFTPSNRLWESEDDRRHGRDGRGWGLYRGHVRRVAYVGSHYLTSRDRDFTLKVFTEYGLLPGDRVEVIDPRIEDAYHVENKTGIYLLSVSPRVDDGPLCEVAWLTERRGHNSNGLRPSRSDGWRVVASNLRRVDN